MFVPVATLNLNNFINVWANALKIYLEKNSMWSFSIPRLWCYPGSQFLTGIFFFSENRKSPFLIKWRKITFLPVIYMFLVHNSLPAFVLNTFRSISALSWSLRKIQKSKTAIHATWYGVITSAVEGHCWRRCFGFPHARRTSEAHQPPGTCLQCHQALSPSPSWWWCHPPLQNLQGMPDTHVPRSIHSIKFVPYNRCN